MKIVVDEYPKDCYNCIFKEDNFSERKNHCTILHVDIGGINDVRFNHRCHDQFILFKDIIEQYNLNIIFDEIKKEADNIRDSMIEKKRLSFIDNIEVGADNKLPMEAIDRFNNYMKENIKEVKETPIRNEDEIKRQREEALDRASKGGFLDTGSVVSIGDEIRKVKDKVRKMDSNFHHKEDTSNDKDTADKTLTKEQADEMMCENFGGLV